MLNLSRIKSKMAASSAALHVPSDHAFSSPSVEVQFIGQEKGRGLFSCKSFNKGDVIFREQPIVCSQFLWNETYKYAACEYCLKPLETAEENVRRLCNRPDIILPFPELCILDKFSITSCPNCEKRYCCSYCQQRAWTEYHETLCLRGTKSSLSHHPLVQLQEAWKQMHYPPETGSIMLLCKMIARVLQSEDKMAMMGAFMQMCHLIEAESMELTHKLLGEEFQSHLDLLHSSIQKSFQSPDIHLWLTPGGFRSLVALVGRNGQGIGTSPLSHWERGVTAKISEPSFSQEEKVKIEDFLSKLYEEIESVVGSFLDTEGSGLYSIQSCINHSCVPNAEITFPDNNSTLAVVALQDIPEGTEILISYLDECTLKRKWKTRNSFLRENYLFSCDCERCRNESQMSSTCDDDSDGSLEEEEDISS